MNADAGNPILATMRPQELQIRKAFVGLNPGAIKALQALRPWMDAHVHDIIEEFYAHLLRFEEPRRLLGNPEVLTHVKTVQSLYLTSLTQGRFDADYVRGRRNIGQTHERVGVSPQWYFGAYSIFARCLFPRILQHYRDQPKAGVEAVKALIAVMHLDMQLAMDAYIASYHRQIESAYEALQRHATDLEEEVAARTSALTVRAQQLETLYKVSAATSRELDLTKVLESAFPQLVDVVDAVGAEVHLVDEEGWLSWAASHGLAAAYVRASQALRFQPGEGVPGQAFATQAPVLVEDLSREPHFLRREIALTCGYRAMLCTPLIAQGNALGTLQLYGRGDHCCPPETLPLVQAIAEQLAVAIANARLHQTVKASEAEYRSLVENIPRLIFRLDTHGRCTFANKAAHTMLGWDVPSLMSASSLRDLLGHPDDWPAATLAKALAGEVVQGVECRLRHRDGTWLWCRLTLYPWRRGDERIFGVEGIAEDVTEQKRVAQEMARSERLALAGQLASGLAHEIGTPLNVIAGTAEYLLADLPGDDPRRDDLDIICQETQRVADLVRRLLGLVRERGEMLAPVDVHALLDHTLRLLEYRLQKENIAVKKQYASTLPPVSGVRQQLEQVFLNLLVNAWHAMPDGGAITLDTRRQGAHAVITVADTGCGIAEEHMGRLFEPFFTTKPPEQGTGLGLAVTHQLIAAHNGRIEIASQVNRGTTVTITLPLAVGEPHASP